MNAFCGSAHISGGVAAHSTTTASVDTWHHILAVLDTDSREVWLDGGGYDQDTETGKNTIPGNFDTTSIGRQGDVSPGDQWDGRLAEMAVWNVRLTAAHALALAAGYRPAVFQVGLFEYWDMIRTASGVAVRSRLGTTLAASTSSPTVGNHPAIIYPTSQQIFVPDAAAAGSAPVLRPPLAPYRHTFMR